MTRWYRAYEGTVTDAKLGEVALVAECSRSVAIAAWHCVLESAASCNSGGQFDTTARRIAVVLGEPIPTIERVLAEMEAMRMIEASAVTSWKNRQYESDSSTERSRIHRERKRNGDATLQHQQATPPDTETDTYLEEPKGSSASGDALSADEVVSEWNDLAQSAGLPVVRKLTPRRRKQLQARLRAFPAIEDWQLAFKTIRETPWMHGANDRGWRADFDFLLQEKSFTKLTEGAYGQA